MSSPGDSIPRRAQNGAALVSTEAIVTDYESGQGYPGQPPRQFVLPAALRATRARPQRAHNL